MQEQAAPKMCQPVFLLELCIRIKLPQVDLLHYVSPFDSQVIDGQIEWRWRAAPVDNRIISERTATKKRQISVMENWRTKGGYYYAELHGTVMPISGRAYL